MNYDTSSYYESEAFKELLNTYEKSVENNSSLYLDANEFVDIADYYNENDRMEEANAVIRTAYKQHPEDSDVLIYIARAHAIEGDLDYAYKIFHQITDKDDREVKFLHFELLYQEGLLKEADKILSELAESEDYSIEILADIVDAYSDQGNKEYALKWLEIIKNHGYDFSKSIRLTEVLCNYYFCFDDYKHAIELFKKLIDKHPYSLIYWIGLAKCYIKDEKYPEAEETVDYALAINDKEAIGLELKAICRLEQNDVEGAIELYKRFEEASVNKSKAWSYLAKAYADLQDHEKVIAYNHQIINYPYSNKYLLISAYHDLALVYGMTESPNKGLYCISKAIELEKEEISLYVIKGYLYLLAKKRNKALSSFSEAISRINEGDEETEFKTWFQIATYSYDANDLDLAIMYYQWIEEKYINKDKSCYMFLTYCYYRQENYQLCLHYLALLKKNLPDIYDDMGTEKDPTSDVMFKESIANIKKEINLGHIDLSTYEEKI